MIIIVPFLSEIATAQNRNNRVSYEQSIPMIKPWKIITQDEDYKGAWTISGDLTGDGKPEMVCTRTMIVDAYRYTASAVAYTLDSKVLWTWGDPKDLKPSGAESQIYDWNNDGKDEVIFITYQDEKSWLVELDGATGKDEEAFRNTGGCR